MANRKQYELPNRHGRANFFTPLWLLALCVVAPAGQAEENRLTAPPGGEAASIEDEQLPTFHRATQDELDLWIEQLGSPRFQVREQAVQQLARCDASAIGSLRKAADGTSDLEVKSRCLAIAAAIYDADVGKRREAFLKEPDPHKNFGFEGWGPFSKLSGEGRLSKLLFAELIESHPDLAESILDDKQELASQSKRMAAEIIAKFRQGGNIELSDSVAMLYQSILLEGNEPVDVIPVTAMLLRLSPYTTEVRRPPMGSALRKLTGQWMRVTNGMPATVLQIAIENDILESVEVARRVLVDPNCEPPLFLVAMVAIMRFGNESDLPLLATWRAQPRLLSPPFEEAVEALAPVPLRAPNQEQPKIESGPQLLGRPPVQTRVYELRYQDLALAATAKLKGREDIRELFPRLKLHPNYVFKPESLAFPKDDSEGRQRVIDALSP